MPAPSRLVDFFQNHKNTSKEDFLQAYPHPFLIYEGDLPDESEVSSKSSTPTNSELESIGTTRRLSAVLSEEDQSFTPVNIDDSYLFLICKREDSEPLPVILGRGESCDVILPLSEISSRHAGVSWSNDRENYTILDLGSTNGTFLNTYPLEPNIPQPISDQDVVKMGESSFLFYSPESLHLYITSPMW